MARHAAAPAMDRRSVRLRRSRRRTRAVALGLAALLALSAAVPLAVLRPWEAPPAAFDASTAVTRTQLTQASRSAERSVMSGGDWTLGSDVDPDARMTVREADNKTVQALINGRDESAVPSDFDPNHATGDDGNGYPYGQCTWWAYKRRAELGLPTASRFGNGGQWADAARRFGYWVDGSPRVGDAVVFRPGQQGADATYGHVAVVEAVGGDGSITISEANVGGRVGPFSRTIPADKAGQLEYVHY